MIVEIIIYGVDDKGLVYPRACFTAPYDGINDIIDIYRELYPSIRVVLDIALPLKVKMVEASA